MPHDDELMIGEGIGTISARFSEWLTTFHRAAFKAIPARATRDGLEVELHLVSGEVTERSWSAQWDVIDPDSAAEGITACRATINTNIYVYPRHEDISVTEMLERMWANQPPPEPTPPFDPTVLTSEELLDRITEWAADDWHGEAVDQARAELLRRAS